MNRMADDFEQRFFDLSIDLLCVLDFSGRFVRLNTAWESVLGYTRDELMSRPFIDFVHFDDRARTLAQNQTVRGGGQARLFENRYSCKDGSFRWLLWNSTRDEGRGVIYGVGRDITERKQAEEERNRLVTELQAAQTEVGTLQGFLPICSYCKRIRDDENYWHAIESYFATRTDTHFTHGICPGCLARAETELENS
jgi:PAS domain S-box-containing protein